MKKKIVLLKKNEIQRSLKQHLPWSVNSKSSLLQRTFPFSSQIDALAFIARVVVHAQVLNHFPEIVFTLGKVKIILTTQDAKGLTKSDLELLERIDRLDKGG